MAYTNAQAQEQLLDELADATDAVGLALAYVGQAYEQLDDDTADRLEGELFRPLQRAYGSAQRLHGAFAARHGLPARTFEPRTVGHRSQVRELLERADDANGAANRMLGELQDSMLPVEVGDRELREGLAGIRELLAEPPARTRELLRTLGR